MIPFLLITSYCFSAHAEEFLFLSFEEYQGLSSGEKKFYINEVRKVTLGFEDHMNSISSTHAKWKFVFSNFIQDVDANNNRNFNNLQMPSSNSVTSNIAEENARINHEFDLWHNNISFVKKNKGVRPTMGTEKNSIEHFNRIYSRIQTLSKKTLTPDQAKNFRSNVTLFGQMYADMAKVEPSIRSKKSEIETFVAKHRAHTGSASAKSSSVSTKSTNSSTKPSAPQNSASITATSKAIVDQAAVNTQNLTAQSDVIRRAPTETAALKCIYAGFIIKKLKCEAPTLLPDGFIIKEISNANFKCATSSGSVICNPLIFGYKNSETPYCTDRSVSASANCSRSADNTDNITRLLAIWSNPENKKAIEDYQSELKKLCDPATQKSADVIKTCMVVQAQFNNKVRAELFIASHKNTNSLTAPVVAPEPRLTSPNIRRGM